MRTLSTNETIIIFYFDKLDDGTYFLEIELPLGLILQDPEYDDTVIYLSIQIKLQDGDFISIGVYIKTDAEEPDGDPPLVTTSMEQIWLPSASSSPTHTSNPTNRASRDRFDGIVDEPASMASSSFLGPVIALVWFSSIVSIAFLYNERSRRKKIRSSSFKKSLEWALEDSE